MKFTFCEYRAFSFICIESRILGNCTLPYKQDISRVILLIKNAIASKNMSNSNFITIFILFHVFLKCKKGTVVQKY